MPTNDEKKIADCPFCRSTAQLYIRNNQYTVRCNNHNCIAYDIEPHFITADSAIAAWNASEVGRVRRLLPKPINYDSPEGRNARLWAKMDVKDVVLYNNSIVLLADVLDWLSRIDIEFELDRIVVTRKEIKNGTKETRTMYDVYKREEKYSTELINGEPAKREETK